MNNFYLYREALNTLSLAEFRIGVVSLNEIFVNGRVERDSFIKCGNFWEQEIRHGFMYDIPGSLGGEYVGLCIKLFTSFNEVEFDFQDEKEFDLEYQNQCNAFAGFNFVSTAITAERQVYHLRSFEDFKGLCNNQRSPQSVKEIWDRRAEIFPNLVFCEPVFEQLMTFSIGDDRTKLIIDKLSRLDKFTSTWNSGQFDYKSCGMKCTPDTPKRVADTRELRTFNCPGIGQRVFNLHIKWSFGREEFRLYFSPEANEYKVYVGYVGDKAGIGF